MMNAAKYRREFRTSLSSLHSFPSTSPLGSLWKCKFWHQTVGTSVCLPCFLTMQSHLVGLYITIHQLCKQVMDFKQILKEYNKEHSSARQCLLSIIVSPAEYNQDFTMFDGLNDEAQTKLHNPSVNIVENGKLGTPFSLGKFERICH